MGKKEHNKCERVEQTFKIANAVRLRGKAIAEVEGLTMKGLEVKE